MNKFIKLTPLAIILTTSTITTNPLLKIARAIMPMQSCATISRSYSLIGTTQDYANALAQQTQEETLSSDALVEFCAWYTEAANNNAYPSLLNLSPETANLIKNSAHKACSSQEFKEKDMLFLFTPYGDDDSLLQHLAQSLPSDKLHAIHSELEQELTKDCLEADQKIRLLTTQQFVTKQLLLKTLNIYNELD